MTLINKIKDNYHWAVLGVILFVVYITTHITTQTITDKISVMVEAQIDSAVNKIFLAIKNGKISNVKTATLQHKGNFYYFDGKIEGKSFLINDDYDYNVTYPNEVWQGYFTHIVATNHTHYYLWSENKIETRDDNLSGWFISDGITTFEYRNKYDTMYLNVLYPVVSRNTRLK